MPSRVHDRASLPESGADHVLMEVFHAFERQAIRWSTLPSRPAPEEPRPVVDLLVARDDLGGARNLVMDLGFLPETDTSERANPCFLAYVPAIDEWLRLRTVSRLPFGPFDALEAEGVNQLLTHRQKTGPVAELDRADAFWIVLLYCLLDNAVIDEESTKRLQELALSARPDGVLARFTTRLRPEGWDSQSLIDSAQSGDRASLERLVGDFRTDAEAGRQTGGRGETARTFKRTLQFALSRGHGLTVALLAPDGAGKSSVASALSASLPVPVRVIYMGRARTSNRGRRGSVASGLLRQWRRHLTARYHRFRGRIVLFDRYTYDALLPPRNPKPARIARRWVFAHAVPPPDLVVLLDAPADLMFQRKDEHSREFLEQRRRDYLELRSRLPGMVVVDAAQELDDVRRDVTSAIWSAYSRQLGKRASNRPSPAAQAP